MSGFSNYKKMPKNSGYYQNPESKKIIYNKRHNGRQVKFATGKTTISEAKLEVEKKLAELFYQNPSKELRIKKGIVNHPLKDVFQELVDERSPQRHPNTVKKWWVAWNYGIKEFWDYKNTSDLNAQNLRKFENWYLANKGERVFFNTHKVFTMLIRYCEDQGYISGPKLHLNDLDKVIETKTKKQKVGRVYTDEEIKGILDNSTPMCRMAVIMGRYLGMRKMEILTLKWSNVDFGKKKIHVWSMKNKKWREVPLIPEIALELKEWRKISSDGEWVFEAKVKVGTHISSQMFDKAWKSAQKKAGIRGWDVENQARFHDLRHTFATQTARDHWAPLMACQMLDMSLQEYQQTYTHVKSSDIMELMKKSFSGSQK